MFKHILVPATGTAADAAVFATALLAARPFAAHLEFLHVRIDVTEIVVAMSAGGTAGGGIQGLIDRLEADGKVLEQKAWENFTRFCTEAGIATSGATPGQGLCADMAVETGSEAAWLAEHGRFADLLVVSRTRDDTEVAMDVLEAALMDTGRPLLIAPAAPPTTLLSTVAIAWKDRPEAARAVAAAMPFIDRAERVVILTVNEDGEAKPDESAQRLARALRWHNAAVSVHPIAAAGRTPADTLLAEAQALGAAMVVMGGYSHSRLREVIFGGFTQRVLRGADLPVLMAH